MRKPIARLISGGGQGVDDTRIGFAGATGQTGEGADNAPEDCASGRQASDWRRPKIGVSKKFTMDHTGYRPETEQT